MSQPITVPRLAGALTPSLLSDRALASQSSALRDLLEQAKRQGMISLAGGLPDAASFPLPELAEIAHRVIADHGTRSLQYGVTHGDENTRHAVAALFGGRAGAAEIVVTTGSQQALDLIARAVVNPADQVVVGDPDYLGALQVFRAHGASLCPIAIDHHGLRTDQLEDELRWGLRPKICYVVPNFHNPSGMSMSVERRRHLNELSCTYGFVVVEDDPYCELYFGETAPTQADGDSELTVRLRSTSKTLAPGLRLGALAGPQWLTGAVVTAKQSTDLHTSSLSQAIVAEALISPWLESHLAGLRSVYRNKRDALVTALARDFSGAARFEVPAGGMFVWARFEDAGDTSDWLHHCLDQGVCFVPGAAFSVARDLSSYVRLSYATGSPDDLREGVARMSSALDTTRNLSHVPGTCDRCTPISE